jgi:hypothetical protein
LLECWNRMEMGFMSKELWRRNGYITRKPR